MFLSSAEKRKSFKLNWGSHLWETAVELLLKMCSWNHGSMMMMKLRKIKTSWSWILTLHEKRNKQTNKQTNNTTSFNINIRDKSTCVSISISFMIVFLWPYSWLSSFEVRVYIQNFFDVVRNKLQAIYIY